MRFSQRPRFFMFLFAVHEDSNVPREGTRSHPLSLRRPSRRRPLLQKNMILGNAEKPTEFDLENPADWSWFVVHFNELLVSSPANSLTMNTWDITNFSVFASVALVPRIQSFETVAALVAILQACGRPAWNHCSTYGQLSTTVGPWGGTTVGLHSWSLKYCNAVWIAPVFFGSWLWCSAKSHLKYITVLRSVGILYTLYIYTYKIL